MKKTLSIIKNVVIWAVVIFAVLMTIFTIISVNTFNRNDRQIMGYKLYIVNSDSMSATDFNAGDLIMVKEVDPRTLEEGDIISYISQDNDSFGETITHKIRKKTTDARGNPGFVTYGTTTGVDDETIVTYMYILGKYENGYVICIFVPFMLLIIYQGVKSFLLFRRYKQQQMEDMQGERDQLAVEKEKNAQMLAELEALRARLEGQDAANANDAPSAAQEAAEHTDGTAADNASSSDDAAE